MVKKLFISILVALIIVPSLEYFSSSSAAIELVPTDEKTNKLLNLGYTNQEIEDILVEQEVNDSDFKFIIDSKGKMLKNDSLTVKSTVTSNTPLLSISKYIVPQSNETIKDQSNKINHIDLDNKNAPYFLDNKKEVISPIDGTLNISENDMSLTGSNGLSFDLKRTYNSSKSQFYDMSGEVISVGTNTYYVEFLVSEYKEIKAYGANASLYSTYEKDLTCNGTRDFVQESSSSSNLIEYYTSKTEALSKVNYWKTRGIVVSKPPWVDPRPKCQLGYQHRNVYFTDGTSYLNENVDHENVFSSTGKTEVFTGGPFYSYTQAQTYKEELLKYKGSEISNSEIWLGSDSERYRYSYRINSNPNPTIHQDSYESAINKVEKSYFDKKFPLGKGWGWDIPSIQITDNTKILHLGSNGSYEIKDNNLQGYLWKDLTFGNNRNQVVNGEKSEYSLINLEGITHYFNSAGELIKIEDTYGNYIDFLYSTNPVYGKVLSEINNNTGKKISISYSTNEVNVTQGQKVVKYLKSKRDDIELLNQVIDPLGRTTTFDYQITDAKFNLLNSNPEKINPYALLVGITHPTGAKTSYNYNGIPSKVKIGENAVNEQYSVVNRFDKITFENGYVNNLNFAQFEYENTDSKPFTESYNFNTKKVTETKTTDYTIKRSYNPVQKSVKYYSLSEIEGNTKNRKIREYTYDELKGITEPIKVTTYFEDLTIKEKSLPVVTEKTFDDYGNVIREVNEVGAETTYVYDPITHLLTDIIEPIDSSLKKYTHYERNPQGSVVKETVKENDAAGKQIYESLYESFDPYGNYLMKTTTANGKQYVNRYEYGPQYSHSLLTEEGTTVTDLNGAKKEIVTAAEYDIYGNQTKYVDGNGNTTVYSYDLLNRETSILNPDNSMQRMLYDDKKNIIEMTDEEGIISFTEWNPLGWKIKEGFKQDGEYLARNIFHYDSQGNISISSNILGQETSYTYDMFDRIISETNPDGHTKEFKYDDIHQTQTTIDEEGNKILEELDNLKRIKKRNTYVSDGVRTEDFKYNYLDQVIQTINPKGKATTNKHDVLGNLNSVIMPNSEITRYEYDYLGNIIKVIYPDNSTFVKNYDEGGRLLSETDPSQRNTIYTYDNNDLMVSKIDRNNNKHQYEYNKRNLIKKVINDSGTVEFDYYLNGKRKNMLDSTGSTKYGYSQLDGSLVKIEYPDGKSISYKYDKLGNKEEVTSPFNLKISYQYNQASKLTSLKLNNDSLPSVQYSYFKNGLVKQKDFSNGTSTIYDYDHQDLVQVSEKSALEVINEYGYGFDGNQNVEKIVENGNTQSLQYDDVNRVQQYTDNEETYQYDLKNNREGLAAANLIGKLQNKSYNYDSNNRLIQATIGDKKVSYLYNGDGLLYERTEGDTTTRFYYDTGKLLATGVGLSSDSNISKDITHYITGTDLEMLVDYNNKTFFYGYDGLNNVRELQDSSGLAVNKYSYDLWGNITEEVSTVNNPFVYTGEYRDPLTSLQYLKSRWYDSALGKFITEDTFEGVPNNPLSLNRYSYVEQNPLIYHDPEGTSSFLKRKLETGTGGGGSKGAGKIVPTEKGKGNVTKGGLNFTPTTAKHMDNAGRFVPVQTLKLAIKGKGYKDPRGSRATMYYTTMYKNGRKYNLEVLYDRKTNTIWHFEYARKAMGPLETIPKPK
ncbi:hypothetical protein B14911_10577 [Bacillus sp. NRRL B-14911]|uniref:RHS repeat domain-containing protein n=1 Tax=Bacillus sp. NRRL B-14911 TaxID=313627 RepID=UPI00006B599E|nr:RHS repeat-associated core domain-containing protein [Bacillus sp. NRRL B-14911]EAR66173.1 hypothetical protein B14911_10577 [Bacillus sp. NRRL B-14911]